MINPGRSFAGEISGIAKRLAPTLSERQIPQPFRARSAGDDTCATLHDDLDARRIIWLDRRHKLEVDQVGAVLRPQERKFLGFTFTDGPEVKRAIAPKSLDRLSGESGRSHDVQRASASMRR